MNEPMIGKLQYSFALHLFIIHWFEQTGPVNNIPIQGVRRVLNYMELKGDLVEI